MKKIISFCLAAAMLFSAGALPDDIGSKSGVMTASADTVGDFEITNKSDKEAMITNYTGKGGEVVMPDTVNGRKITYVSSSVFSNAKKKNIKITSVVLPKDLRMINSDTFKELTDLASVQIPSNITVIGSSAFEGCTSLKSIAIPDRVTSLNSKIFYKCTNLETVTLPKSVESIGTMCFAHTKWVENKAKQRSDKLVILYDSFLIDGKSCTGSVTIPSNIKTICGGAFSANQDLKAVTIPQNVKLIDYCAFYNCKNLKTVNFPKTIPQYGTSAFDVSGWVVEMRKKNPVVSVNGVIIDTNGCSGKVVIPSNIATVPENAFYNNENITEIVIPSTVKTIGSSAIRFCKNLKKVTIQSNITTLPDRAISYNKALEEVVLPKTLKKLEKNSLASNNLKKIVLPDTLEVIGEYALYSNSELEQLTLPSSLKRLEGYALSYTSLKSITFPKSLEYVGSSALRATKIEEMTLPNIKKYDNGAFSYMPSLKRVKVENGVTLIPQEMFNLCYELNQVDLPETVKTIGTRAFYWCDRLYHLYLPKSVTTIGDRAFSYSTRGLLTHRGITSIGENNMSIGAVVRCYKGSYAETYAKQSGLKVEYYNTKVDTQRISGKDRFQTAVQLAQQIKRDGRYSDTVLLVSSSSYADALAAGALGYKLNAPILLTTKDELNKDTLTEIKRRKATKAIIIGGTGVISQKVIDQLKKNGVTSERIGGKDRFETSVLIAKRVTDKPKYVFFTYYNNYPDALSVSSVSAANSYPILYIKGDGQLEQYTKKYLADLDGKSSVSGFIIGGTGLISEKAETYLKDHVEHFTRVCGANRYQTCTEVLKFFNNEFSSDTDLIKKVCVTTGLNFPDALACGVFAAQNGMPVMIADGQVNNDRFSFLRSRSPEKLYLIGGTGVVPQKMSDQLVCAAKSGW